MKLITKLWIGMGVLMVLSPLGLFLPEHFKAGSAWGEWSIDEIRRLVGYVPAGLKKMSSFWNAPMPDYAFKGWEEKGLGELSISYIVSAAVGVLVVISVTFLIARILSKKK